MSSFPAKTDKNQSPIDRGPPFQSLQDPANKNNVSADLMNIATGVGKSSTAGARFGLTKKKKKAVAPAFAMGIDATAKTKTKKTVVDPPTAEMAALLLVDNNKTEVDATVDDEDYSELVPASAKTEHKTIDFNAESAEMDRIFEEQAASQLRDLPKFQRPKRFRKTTLFFRHQQDGIRWLIEQERNPRPNPFSYVRTLKNGTVAGYDKFTKRRLATEGHAPVSGTLHCLAHYQIVLCASTIVLSCPIVQTSSLSSPPIVPLTRFQGRFWLMRWVSGGCLSRLVFGREIL